MRGEVLKYRNYIIRILITAVALTIVGVGIGIFLFSGLGVDPGSVLITGISNALNVSFGVASAIINFLILAVVFFIDKKYVNIASVLAIIVIGFTADATNSALANIIMPEQMNIALSFVFIIVGCTIVGFAVAAYIRADLGVSAFDLVSEIISDKLKLPYRWVRIAGDLTYIAVGFLLGGVVGVGTLVAGVLTGLMVAFFRPFANRFVDKLVK